MTITKRTIWTVLKVAVVAVVLGWLVQSDAIKWEYFRLGFDSLPWLLAGALLILVSIMLTGLRYWTILRGNGIKLSLLFTLKTELASTFFNVCSIGPVGGDMVRTYYVYKTCQNGATVAGSTVADRLFGLFALIVISGICLLTVGADSPNGLLKTIRPIILGAMGGGLGFEAIIMLRQWMKTNATIGLSAILCVTSLFMGFAEPFGSPLFWLWCAAAVGSLMGGIVVKLMESERIQSTLLQVESGEGLLSHAGKLVKALMIANANPTNALLAFSLSLVQQSCFILAVQSMAMALPLPVDPGLDATFFATSLTFILSVIPMPGAGLGVSEAAMGFLLTLASPEVVGGASVFLCFRAWLVLTSALGLPFYFSSELSKHR